jgi:hypothetical protein
MPKVFDGAPFPLRIVFTTAVEERPAAFGLVAANELGIAKHVVIARIKVIEIRLRFMRSS